MCVFNTSEREFSLEYFFAGKREVTAPPPPAPCPFSGYGRFLNIYVGFRFKVGELNETKSSNGEEKDSSL